MTTTSGMAASSEHHSFGRRVQHWAALLLRLALIMIFLPIGLQKFTAYEAEAIEPFVANSPIFSWAYDLFGLRATAGFVGTTEILVAIGLFIGLFARGSLPSLLGAVGSALTYVVTLSFLLTTPDVFTVTSGGIPVLTPAFGQFLMKDLVLLSASIYLVGEALAARGK